MSFRYPPVCAVAAVIAIGVGGTPANAVVCLNGRQHNFVLPDALNMNALASSGSALDDLNGVAVEAATPPRAAAGETDRAQGDSRHE
jgi:hypothetical protein